MTEGHKTLPSLPRILVVLRHGQYPGNVASFPTQAMQQDGLTEIGVKQIIAAREWLKRNKLLSSLLQLRTSPLMRAQESARLVLPGPWVVDLDLTERDRGDESFLSIKESAAKYPDSTTHKVAHPISWRPTNGESLEVEVSNRVRQVLKKLDHRPAIWSTHFEFAWAARFFLAGISETQMLDWRTSADRRLDIGNGRIDLYATEARQRQDSFSWFRSVAPELTRPSFDTGWQPIRCPLPDLNHSRKLDGSVTNDKSGVLKQSISTPPHSDEALQ